MAQPSTVWFSFRAQYPIFSPCPARLYPNRQTVTREPPIVLPAVTTPNDISKSAVLILLHGLSDDAEGLTRMSCTEPSPSPTNQVPALARHLQVTAKLDHLSLILPNAAGDYCLTPEWYIPRRLPSRPEQEIEEEDDVGLLASVKYIETLIDEQVGKGVPENRIVLGGFSQGHAVALLAGLISSKYAGRLAGLVGFSGYLPMANKIPALRREAGLPAKADGDMALFLTSGTKDTIVPERYSSMCSQVLLDLGVRPENVTYKVYEGLGHAMRSDELQHFCQWLGKIVPPLE